MPLFLAPLLCHNKSIKRNLKVKAEKKFETGPVAVSSSPPMEKPVSGLKFTASTQTICGNSDQ